MQARASILVAHDHPMVCYGVRRLLEEHHLAVSAEAATVPEALLAQRRTSPDLVLADVSRAEDRNGAELVRRLRVARADVAMTVFVGPRTPDTVLRQIVGDGVRGFVSTARALETLPTAVHRVLAGHVYVDDDLLGQLVGFLAQDDEAAASPTARLTDRELEVLELCGQGFRPATIAEHLHVSPKTVHSHRENLKKKLRMGSTRELDRFAIRWLRGELDA